MVHRRENQAEYIYYLLFLLNTSVSNSCIITYGRNILSSIIFFQYSQQNRLFNYLSKFISVSILQIFYHFKLYSFNTQISLMPLIKLLNRNLHLHIDSNFYEYQHKNLIFCQASDIFCRDLTIQTSISPINYQQHVAHTYNYSISEPQNKVNHHHQGHAKYDSQYYKLIILHLIIIHKMTDKPDLSWIEKDVACWIYSPLQQIGPIFTKGVIKFINKINNKVSCALQNDSQVQTSAVNLQKRRLSNSIQRDLITLQIINGAQILYQLKKRLQQQKIHTYLWNSLLIVNPFVKIPGLYDQAVMKSYYEKVAIQKKSLSQVQPHIYAFVCNIVNNMKISQKVQMISISGESGSGKTQTNKQCLRIVSFMCEGHLKKSEIPTFLIQQRILNCDSVLQCFGNAKTSKNDNSSRFGKLVTQLINTKDMQIIKCQVKVFFLEKSRIIHQNNTERNFHIFYQLITHCPQNQRSHLGFKKKDGFNLTASDFTYLSSKNTSLKQQDLNMWNSLLNSFKLLDITQTQRQNIFEIVAAILHIGNIQFNHATLNDKDPCEINENVLPLISRLLMITPAQLKQLLLYDLKQMPNKQKYFGPMTQRQCQQGRDSLAKILYQNLFQWIVQQLNKKVNQNHKPEHNIKVIKMLDIYGFQVFQNNSFEQLCVNYTNERIHQIYLDQVFKHQIAELKKQGLENSIPKLKFTDNSKIIQILETNPNSVFNILDQTCMFSIKDEEVSSKVNNMLKDHYSFGALNIKKNNFVFTIKHTPGDIQYNSMGFISKNKDLVRKFIIDKLSKSKSPIIGQKFSQILQSMEGTNKSKRYLSRKIINQISFLIMEMNSNSDMHFIRCIKPNQTKSPLTFVQRVCFQQIKHLGVLDTVRMRKDSYHVRMSYRDFYKKYGILSGNVAPLIGLSQGQYTNKQCKQMTKNMISSKFRGANIDYLYGEQKFFMKMDTNNYLDAILRQKTKNIVHNSTIIKVAFRHYHKRDERSYFTNQARLIQKALRNYLRDIIKIKRINAAKTIWSFWVKNCDSYFKRKRRIPLMAIQKYIKKITTKKYYQSKHHYMLYAKDMINSMGNVQKLATRFENHTSVKQQLIGDIFDSIWIKMQKHYIGIFEKYFKTGSTLLKNRIKVISANDKSRNRLIIKNNFIIKKYFKTIHWAKYFQNMHDQIVKVQKCIKMALMRRNFNSLKSKVVKIQRAWRNYKYEKQHNKDFTIHYFGNNYEMQKKWKSQLHRNLKVNNFNLSNDGIERILEKFQKLKKDKIILFYYLIDVEILSNDPSINNWIENYLYVTQESLFKLNPIQYIDVSNTHTVATTTSKVYTWGNLQDPVIEQFQTNVGKLFKIQAQDYLTRVDSINPATQQFLTVGGQKKGNQKDQNTNKQWFSLEHSFVLLNGIVLTMQNISFTKVNMPQKIAQISCGFGHVICRSILKKVYSWGKNNCGQLGTGDFFETNSMDPICVDYFYKKRIPVCQVAASPEGSIVMDYNNKVYWFGSNGTIKNVCFPLQFNLSSKSVFLGNQNKYSPLRIVSRWSKTVSLIGLTIACHDDVLKNQFSMRKKLLQNLMNKWNQDINAINPPYSQSVADHISERHMPLPMANQGGSNTQRTLTNRQIRQKIINDIHKIQQAERQLLRTKKVEPKIEKRRKY